MRASACVRACAYALSFPLRAQVPHLFASAEEALDSFKGVLAAGASAPAPVPASAASPAAAAAAPAGARGSAASSSSSAPATGGGAAVMLAAVQASVDAYFRGQHREAESLLALPELQPAVRALREELFGAWLDAEQRRLARAREKRDKMRRLKERARARAGAGAAFAEDGGEGEDEDAEAEGEGEEALAMFADSGLVLTREQRARARSVLATCALPRIMVRTVWATGSHGFDSALFCDTRASKQAGKSFCSLLPAPPPRL